MRNKLPVIIALTAIAGMAGCSHTRPNSDQPGLVQAESDKIKADAEQAEKTRLAQAEQAQARARLDQEQAEQERVERARLKANIESVLEQDSKTNADVQSVAEIVTRMRAIDTSGCPNDFRAAYLDHIYAWESMVDVERDAKAFESESNSDGVLIESFIRGLCGDPLGKANEIREAKTELQRRYQEADQQIEQTFHKVEETAILYDADLPK